MGEDYGSFVRLRGGETAIQMALSTSPRFMLITYDQLPRVKNTIVELLASGNVYMFLDESHRIKGGKQIKRADAILEIAHLPKRKLVMERHSYAAKPQRPYFTVFVFIPNKKMYLNLR